MSILLLALISGLVRGRFLRSVVSTGDSSGGTWSSSSVSCPLTVASKAIPVMSFSTPKDSRNAFNFCTICSPSR